MSRAPRIFIHDPLSENAAVTLGAAAAGHVSRVLRLQAGDELVLFDGRGGEFPARLTEVRGTAVKARTLERRDPARESPWQITLAQGVSRGERMDWVVQKATELGVARIVPVITERSVVRLDASQAEKKRAHWRGIAIAACEQCGRNRLPEIAVPLALDTWLAGMEPAANGEPGANTKPAAARKPSGQKWLLAPEASSSLISASAVAPAETRTVLLIGPEGGLTDTEIQAAHDRGFMSTRLGPRILRTETAAIAAIAILQATLGDLA